MSIMGDQTAVQYKLERLERGSTTPFPRDIRPAADSATEFRAPDATAHEHGVRPLLDILRRRSRMIATIVGAGTALLAVAALLFPPRYTAMAQIEILPPATVQGDRPALSEPRAGQMTVDTHMVKLKARDFLRAVHEASNSGGSSQDHALHPAPLLAPPAASPTISAPAAAHQDLALEEFEKNVGVTQLLVSSVLAIRFTSADPEEAARIANRVVVLYSDHLRKSKEGVLQAEIDRLDLRLAELSKELDTHQGQLQRRLAESVSHFPPNAGDDLRNIKHKVRADAQLMAELVRRQADTRRRYEQVTPEIRIVSFASVPAKRSSLHPILFIVPGIVLLFVGASFLAVSQEQLDQGLRSSSEVSAALSAPCIGLVPKFPALGLSGPVGYVTNNPFAPYSEAIRSVTAAIGLAARTRDPEVVLLSCSEPGEAKTMLAVSMAQSIASVGNRVLVVDLDVRTPGVLRELGLDASLGVVDLVLGRAPPEDVILRPDGLAFDVLPMSAEPVDPLRLLSGDELRKALTELRARYDVIIIDGPSALGRPEAQLLATLADKVVLVVKWGTTRKLVVQNAARALSGAGTLARGRAGIMAAVVTQVPLRRHAQYHFGDAVEILMRHGRQLQPRRNIAGTLAKIRSASRHIPGRALAERIGARAVHIVRKALYLS